MAQYAHAIKRVTISGQSFGGAEIWSTGFYVGAVGEDVSNPTQQFADAIRTAWTTFFQATPVQMGTNWTTKEIKVAQVGTDGKTSLDNVIYAPYGTPIAGTYGSNVYPPQISVAATLEHVGARGLAAKGRMYLPGIARSVGNNGQMDSTSCLAIANALKTFLDAVNAAAPNGERVILASQGRRTKGADGKYTPVPGTAVNALVDRVKVGSVFDTQRRRRNNLVELYQSAALA